MGFHQYKFKKGDVASVILDISATRLTRDKSTCTEAHVEILSDHSLQGYARYEGGWGGKNSYNCYFYAEFDQGAIEKGTWNQNNLHKSELKADASPGKDISLGAYFKYQIKDQNKPVKLKLSIAYQSIAKAKAYFDDLPGWDFDEVKNEGEVK